MKEIIPVETTTNRIYLIRHQKVMLDRDLGGLYGVDTRVLKQAVRRNIRRFPEDFMFELTPAEEDSLRSQIVTLKGRGQHSKYLSFAFAEQGVAMLSSVLKSARAIEENIAIMRAFVQMRRILATHEDLKRKIEEMEEKYDERFRVVFEAIRQLLAEDEKSKRKIGF